MVVPFVLPAAHICCGRGGGVSLSDGRADRGFWAFFPEGIEYLGFSASALITTVLRSGSGRGCRGTHVQLSYVVRPSNSPVQRSLYNRIEAFLQAVLFCRPCDTIQDIRFTVYDHT